MARRRTVHACTECGSQQPKWLGRCPECGSWGTLVEEVVSKPPASGPNSRGADDLLAQPDSAGAKPLLLEEVETGGVERVSSGIAEFDRVLGGGFVPGSVVLLGGEPGVGKSTLALQTALRVAAAAPAESRTGGVLYISGEESLEQIRLRAGRLPDPAARVSLLSETRVEFFASSWRDLRPRLVIIDSIQTVRTDAVESAPGSVAQVRESAALLATTAKRHGTILLLVGHVNKEGNLAGPRVLEHLVDVVLGFEGDRNHAFRLLRASKNRFGSTQEVGVFNMGEQGLAGVENPSELFLAERSAGAPGSCIIPLLEGTRPMLVEIQALVAPASYGTPRRTTLGLEDGRVALLLAVLDRRSDIDLVSRDVYVNAAGGVRVGEPAADLGLALAIASSVLDLPLPPDVAACGEIGLGGEVRRVARLDARMREAGRLGFRRMLVPRAAVPVKRQTDCEAIGIENVAEAVAWLRANARVHEPVN